ncbi:hypothetical protein LC653_44335 [Nostoc sp. CHAB 5784]|uniref:hypothetical protein n=1 Tax=Nostoc mirabile TaxID=2907820 RepID=UPI001E4746D2|nr:hypothetical protein [Nostoc mirabile]MCC5670617.1 hypothetical protein [Nostoc mirabile CHAB5784]
MTNKDFEYPENYPVPDPAWSYAGVHLEAYRAEDRLVKAIKYVSSLEESNPGDDAHLIAEFETVITHLQGAIATACFSFSGSLTSRSSERA